MSTLILTLALLLVAREVQRLGRLVNSLQERQHYLMSRRGS